LSACPSAEGLWEKDRRVPAELETALRGLTGLVEG